MTISRTWTALFATVFIGGCMLPGGESSDDKYKARFKKTTPVFGDYVADIQQDAAKYIPALDKDLSVAAPIPLRESHTQMDMVDLVLAKIDADKICFSQESIGDASSYTAEQVGQTWMERLTERHLAIRGITSLEAERGKPLFPAPPGSTSPKTVEVLDDAVRDFDNRERGTVERRRAVKFLVCAPRPEITAATKYLAITLHDDYNNTVTYRAPAYGANEEDRKSVDHDNMISWLRKDVLYLISIGE